MTDYAEMLDRLDAANAALRQSQAREGGADARIKALVQERDSLLSEVEDMRDMKWQRDAADDRAAKAEADLSAARDALEQGCTGCTHAPERDGDAYDEECMSCRRFYADGFAAARALGGSRNDAR